MECQPRVLNAAHLSCFTKFLGEEAKFSGDCGVADWSQGLWHSARQAIRLAPSDLFAGWMSALLLSGKCWVLCLATLQVFCWVGLSGWHHQASSCSSSQIKGTGVVSENKTRLTCWRCLLVCYQDSRFKMWSFVGSIGQKIPSVPVAGQVCVLGDAVHCEQENWAYPGGTMEDSHECVDSQCFDPWTLGVSRHSEPMSPSRALRMGLLRFCFGSEVGGSWWTFRVGVGYFFLDR